MSKELSLPERELQLKRVFGLFKAAKLYKQYEFHAFCKWAKGQDIEELEEYALDCM